MKKSIKSFTFVELLFTALIMVMVFVSFLQAFNNNIKLIALAREINIATDDLKDTLEAMRSTAFADILTIAPDDGFVASPVVGGFLLRNESIQAKYYRSDGTDVYVTQGNIPDPLLIELILNWTGKDNRPHAQSMRTLRTRGL